MDEEKKKQLEEEIYRNKLDGYVEPSMKYLATRYIECFCIALFIFGLLWEGTERFSLTTPQFMMMYGGMGAIVTEVLARIFSKKKK